MLLRCAPLCLLLCAPGCRQLAPAALPPSPVAVRCWTEGQLALQQGEKDKAKECFEQGLDADPQFAPNHLSLAAACLEKGDDEGACLHLAHFVAAQPDQLKARTHYAELLLRLHRLPEARRQFERCDADAQERDPPLPSHVIHCHSQLTKIAIEEDDDYAEHLHRGIGLYLLSRERASLPDPDGELSAESLLFRASLELRKARRERPGEARPCWYLYEVWSELGQRQPAMKYLHQAKAAEALSYLTSAERRDLRLACWREQTLAAKGPASR
jgi:tetratricopeptide (TPR) repeat protein